MAKDFYQCLAELQADRPSAAGATGGKQRPAPVAPRQPAQTEAQRRQDIEDAARKAFDAYARGRRLTPLSVPSPARPQAPSAPRQPTAAPLDAKSAFGRWLRSGRAAVDSAGRPSWAWGATPAGVETKDLGATMFADAPTAPASGQMVRFSGLLAAYGNVDYSGDILLPGCCAQTLIKAKAQQTRLGAKYLMPLLYDHNPERPIGGIVSAYETSQGLMIDAEIDPNTRDGHDAISQISQRYNTGLSIGYFVVSKRFNAQGVREIAQLDLFEGSVVALPANPLAGVTSFGGLN